MLTANKQFDRLKYFALPSGTKYARFHSSIGTKAAAELKSEFHA